MGSNQSSVQLTAGDLRSTHLAVQALRLSAILVAAYEVVYQYYFVGLTRAALPQSLLSIWMCIEFGAWLAGTMLLSNVPERLAQRRVAPPVAPPVAKVEDLSLPPIPGGDALLPAASPEGTAIRMLNAVALALLLIYLGAHHDLLPWAIEQRAALAYLVMRTITLWLSGGVLLRVAPALPGGDPLARATIALRRLLTAALLLWIATWSLAVLDAPLELGLLAHPQSVLRLRSASSCAEWLLIASSIGSLLVLGRFLQALEAAAHGAGEVDCPDRSDTVRL